MTTPPLRGKRGAERRLGERVVDDFVRRHRIDAESAVDFDVAEVDREIEDVERTAAAETAETGRLADTARRGTDPRRPQAAGSAARVEPAKGGRRLPDLSALPPLLAATGSFEALRDRLGPAVEPGTRHGRHAGLTSVPHGAKSFLAATLALATPPERLVWVARDAEIGDRVAEELGAWLGDADAVAVLEPRSRWPTSEASSSPTRRPRAWLRWPPGGRVGRGSSSPASRPSSSGRSTRPTCHRRRGSSDRRPGSDSTPSSESCSTWATSRRSRWPAGANSPGGAGSSTCSRRGSRCRSGSTSSATRSTRCGGSIRPTNGRSDRSPAPRSCRRANSSFRAAASRSCVHGSVAARPACPSGWPPTWPGSRAQTADAARAAGDPAERDTRALDAGDAAEVWATIVCPATALDHLDPGRSSSSTSRATWPRPRSFLWRQADERRADLIAAGDLPKDWPATYLPPRDWKSRLLAARTLELSWESEPGEAIAGGGLSSGDLFGWREPRCPPARAAGSSKRSRAGREDGARIVLASDQAARLAELLDEAGRRSPRSIGSTRATAGRRGARRAQPERRVHRRPRRARLRDRPRAVRDGPGPAPEGDAPRRAARHPRAADARRPRCPHRSRHRSLRADAPARRTGRGARLPRAPVRGRRPDLRPGRADPAGQPLLGWRATDAVPAGRDRLAAHEAARQAGGRRPGRGAPGAVRRPDLSPRPRVRRRHAVAGRDGGELPVRGDRRPAPRGRRDQARHGGRPADGPARRRRRRLRQDRGRAPGRVQGDPGRQAGRGPRAHDGPRRAAPPDVQPAVRGVPARGPAAVPVRLARTSRRRRSPASTTARSTSSSAPTGCCRRTSGSATSAWSSSTRSSASAWPPRSG